MELELSSNSMVHFSKRRWLDKTSLEPKASAQQGSPHLSNGRSFLSLFTFSIWKPMSSGSSKMNFSSSKLKSPDSFLLMRRKVYQGKKLEVLGKSVPPISFSGHVNESLCMLFKIFIILSFLVLTS